MNQSDYDTLVKTGKMPYTKETFTSTELSYSKEYRGVLVEFTLKNGTIAQLEGIGAIQTNSPDLRALYLQMPETKNVNNWRNNNAYFKLEDGVLNIGLGRGKALSIFNENTRFFEVK